MWAREVVTMELPFFGQYNQGAPRFAEYIDFMDRAGFLPFAIPDQSLLMQAPLQVDFVFVKNTSEIVSKFQAVLSHIGGR